MTCWEKLHEFYIPNGLFGKPKKDINPNSFLKTNIIQGFHLNKLRTNALKEALKGPPAKTSSKMPSVIENNKKSDDINDEDDDNDDNVDDNDTMSSLDDESSKDISLDALLNVFESKNEGILNNSDDTTSSVGDMEGVVNNDDSSICAGDNEITGPIEL